MCEGIKLAMNEDGKWGVYDDTFDITIHCESEEEQERARKLLSDANKMQWIPCSERMPDSDERVLVTYTHPALESPAITTYKIDEEGNGDFFIADTLRCSTLGVHINAWMPLPEPYRKEKEDE